MADIDFSQPGYPAREHAGQQAFDKRRAKRALPGSGAPKSDAPKDSSLNPPSFLASLAKLSQVGPVSPGHSKADRLYRGRKTVR